MSERSKFENEWAAAFEGSKQIAPDKVWSEVKAELATLEADKQKRMVIYWRRVGIAATVSLLVMLGGYYLINKETGNVNDVIKNSNTLADHNFNNTQKEPKYERERLLSSDGVNGNIIEENAAKKDNSIYVNPSKLTTDHLRQILENKQLNNSETFDKLKILVQENTNDDIYTDLTDEDKNVVAFSNQSKTVQLLNPIDSFAILATLNTDIYLQAVPNLNVLIKYKKENDFKKMWAGLSMGGGSFNPNVGEEGFGSMLFSSADEQFSTADLDVQSVQTNNIIKSNEATETSAFAYQFSLNFGRQLSKRFLIESGVEYAKYSSIASSNLTSNKNQTSEAFLRNTGNQDFSYNNLQNTATYQLSNNYEYVSIPISVGYLLFDKKIGILISSGISADLFLSNTLRDESNQHASVVQKGGADSPYRPVNINALFGGEIYYSWSKNYVIAIDPGYRYSLTGITKPDANFKSRPTSFFIALKFKYIL